MYSIIDAPFGYRILFKGCITDDEIKQWYHDSVEVLAQNYKKFNVLVDAREVEIFPSNSRQVLQEGQELYKKSGMKRSCVLLPNDIMIEQLKQIATDSGIINTEIYINTDQCHDWEYPAMKWLNHN